MEGGKGGPSIRCSWVPSSRPCCPLQGEDTPLLAGTELLPPRPPPPPCTREALTQQLLHRHRLLGGGRGSSPRHIVRSHTEEHTGASGQVLHQQRRALYQPRQGRHPRRACRWGRGSGQVARPAGSAACCPRPGGWQAQQGAGGPGGRCPHQSPLGGTPRCSRPALRLLRARGAST